MRARTSLVVAIFTTAGPTFKYARTTGVTLGACLIDLGQNEAARGHLVAAWNVLVANFSPEHARVRRADDQLARLK